MNLLGIYYEIICAIRELKIYTVLVQGGLSQDTIFESSNPFQDDTQIVPILKPSSTRDATRIAFSVGLIEDGESWMNMIKDRNQTNYTYNKVTAKAIAENITTRFFVLFKELEEKMQVLENES